MDSTLKALGGCGRFQVLVVISVFTAEFTAAFSLMFMTFGLYNPGWRCLDNQTTNSSLSSMTIADQGWIDSRNKSALGDTQENNFRLDNNEDNVNKANKTNKFNDNSYSDDVYMTGGKTNKSYNNNNMSNKNNNNKSISSSNNENNNDPSSSGQVVYVKDQCPIFKTCQQVEFNPESSTIVSQWNLICDKAWIPKTITSIQMVGVMIGCYLGGYLVDKIGRKRTVLLNTVLNGALNLIAAFSSSWQVFAVLRFFIGMTYAGMSSFPFAYASELTPSKWRSLIASSPAWNLGATLFAVVAMVTKDWKTIHIVNGVIVLGFVGALIWVPESLRWLIVRGKFKRAVNVANCIASVNNKPALNEETFVHLVAAQSQREDGTKRNKYHWYDLWRKEVRWYTVILGFLWMSMTIIYYTTSFGAKNFVGDIYVNLILLFIIEIPISALSTIAPNVFGRKRAAFVFYLVTTLSLITIVFLDRFGSDEDKGTHIFVLVLVGRCSLTGAWYVLYILIAEIYPTVIRGTILGYCSFMIRVGGIIVPYLIPNDSDSNFISFLLMACLIGVCSVLLLFLPETKGKGLRETWSEEYLPTTPLESLSPKGVDIGSIDEEGEELRI